MQGSVNGSVLDGIQAKVNTQYLVYWSWLYLDHPPTRPLTDWLLQINNRARFILLRVEDHRKDGKYHFVNKLVEI